VTDLVGAEQRVQRKAATDVLARIVDSGRRWDCFVRLKIAPREIDDQRRTPSVLA